MARIIFLHEKKSLLMERSCRSWRILYSIPYPNLELNVVRQVVKGYRGSKWYMSHFIWENGHDTKVRINITGNESVHVGIRLGWAAYESLKTYPYLNFSNIWLLTSSVQKRVPVFESERDENWELRNTHTVKENMCEHIFEPIRKYWLNDLSNIFFSWDKISSSTALWQEEKRRLCILNNKMIQSSNCTFRLKVAENQLSL